MRTRLLFLGTIVGWAVFFGIAAGTMTARVIGVTDGDTITVLATRNVEYRIRLGGIDAPERDQALGTRSTQNLSRLVFGNTVTLDCGKEESYGRLVCKVLLPNGEDADLDQIKAGLAWHYKQFEREQTPQDRKLYAAAEDAARESRRGLWADAHPIPPWDFRTPRRRGSVSTARIIGLIVVNNMRDLSAETLAVTFIIGQAAQIMTISRPTIELSSRTVRMPRQPDTGRRGIARDPRSSFAREAMRALPDRAR